MAKGGERLMVMNRVDGPSDNLALKARAVQESKEVYEIEEEEEMTSTSDIVIDFAFFVKKVDKPKFVKDVKPRLKPNPINERYKKNKGRAFVGAEYISDEEGEDKEKEAGVTGLAFSEHGSLFTYDYSKDYSTESSTPNVIGSSFMARMTYDDDSDDSSSSTVVGSFLMEREAKVMESPPSLSIILDDDKIDNQDEDVDLKGLFKANKLVKDELKKLGENHDLLQDTYKKALGSLNDPIVAENVASSSTSFTCEHAKLVEEHVCLKEELSVYVETNEYLESLVTKYGLNYYPTDSTCEQATILEENVRLTKELAKFTTSKNKMGLDDLLSMQKSNNKKYGLRYAPKSYKKNNYKKEKPAQEKNKKVTNDGKAPKGKTTSGDRTRPNNQSRMYEVEIKAIRTDNGTEFNNYTMQEFVDDEGIQHEFSAPYTHQQNSVVERKNRTIIEMARTMLSEFKSPHHFWG
ncbi:hypothetical protein QYE76_060276 [Lolium multiflorum]|uniref:Integrase catalytic domain-containing protein n=1 Tax=Lolium multiflorum TaxID=4521 RepID=A0AAD8RYH2_LOLMU|nr:hypothetical protein QYE76_060276 [Lolium multiflorum]